MGIYADAREKACSALLSSMEEACAVRPARVFPRGECPEGASRSLRYYYEHRDDPEFQQKRKTHRKKYNTSSRGRKKHREQMKRWRQKKSSQE